MVHLTKKSKVAIITIAAVAVAMMIIVPLVGAQVTADNQASNMKTITAYGNAYQVIDNDTIKYYPANLTLTLQPTSTNGTVKIFSVVSGTLTINGISYTLTSGNGAVLTGRHIVLMKSQGTSADGQTITMKLEAFYAYSWSQGSTILRIGAKLQTDDANYTLLMKATI